MPVINGSSNLFVQGHSSLNATQNLYTQGHIQETKTADLYIDGIGESNNNRPLFINGWAYSLNSTMNLVLRGIDVGVSVGGIGVTIGGVILGVGEGDANIIYYTGASKPLYIEVEPTLTGSMPLYIENTQSSVPLNDSMPLVLYSNDYLGLTNNNIALFIKNSAIDNNLNLYISGDGMWENYTPATGSMPLFINRENEAVMLPLFLKAIDNSVNSTLNLFIESTISLNDNIDLVIPNVVQSINSTSTLFIKGVVPQNNLIPLFLSGQTTTNNNVPLFLKQSNAELNSTITAYIMGANISTGNINLVIPSVTNAGVTLGGLAITVDGKIVSMPIDFSGISDINNSFPLYIFGWG